ncbi:MAG: carbohydrate ABC transporter substrate-binding protein [Oscillatoriales cyanobacterium RM1_1_9]|nr:carbohydrate ABC transporter substrate-binding protein [Oscillatoriales cyanobacterium SM2_3_0]NJO46366.1 carbohydrate ABC transporter substrate-binding protein [Oscillatoriales cyanobacterium RM2_1_1]NJO71654.1 carbohydrate ABC transporter substrate-binding protein [Oscillatoriales cyanobacterium RM1_1_9]
MSFPKFWLLPDDTEHRGYTCNRFRSLGLCLTTGLVVLLGACSFRPTSTEPTNLQPSPKAPAKLDTPSAANTVTILGAITGEQQQRLEAALAPFVEATGIEVIYQGTEAFTTLLPVRVESGHKPDVVMFPQPGLMADFARRGLLVPLDRFIDLSQLQQSYGSSWIDLGTVDQKVYGIWYRVSIKSLVWYSPKAFQAAGYQIPKTWDDLKALSNQIVADGNVPWCLGMESGDATGWVGTDWIEDILLRTAGPKVYDQWVKHQIPFDSAPVRSAFKQFGQIALDPKLVVGGTIGVLNTPFSDSPNGLFTDPPGCYLHRQASFISNFFPQGVVLGKDVDVFLLPPIRPEFGTPILIGGDMIAMFNDTPAARKLVQYMTTVTPHEIWASLGGYLSPNTQVDLSAYPDPVSRKQAEILRNADVIRFDGSDMMPGTVGTESFWLGIINYMEGGDLNTILQDIDQSWPTDGKSISEE